jgi:hypothetical protein
MGLKRARRVSVGFLALIELYLTTFSFKVGRVII